MLNDIRAEMVRAKAYRLTIWILPFTVLVCLGIGAFSVMAIQDALQKGAELSSQVEAVAFLPGAATFFSGLLLAAWATTLVTADWSSGTVNYVQMAMADGRILRARIAVLFGAVLTITLASIMVMCLMAVLFLPTPLIAATLAAPVLWANVVGAFMVHATWACLAVVAAWWVPKPAISMGLVLVVLLATPALKTAATSLGVETSLFSFLPASLMQAATVTGAEAMTKVAPLAASGLLLLWCAGAVASGPIALRRDRRYR